MAAPEFVPTTSTHQPRSYASPPWRSDEWQADRPGEVVGGEQPREQGRMGAQGPDQGYALKLAHLMEDQVHLAEAEHLHDAVTGAVAVALKRASVFGRAPVIHDLRVAFTVWGFLAPQPPPDLVALRRPRFQGLEHPHHYDRVREVVDVVPERTLRMSPDEVEAAFAQDWRALLAI
ncbi:MAG: hypothetical protein JWM05_3747 [Acidimicrobiales bacterium]|nr:hypothetical protein [Acidimicrobiales bacterium]